MFLAQLPGHGAKNSGPNRLHSFVDQHHSIVIEPNVGTILSTVAAARANDDPFYNFSLFNVAVGDAFFHGTRHNVADFPVGDIGVVLDVKTLNFLGPGVVRDSE